MDCRRIRHWILRRFDFLPDSLVVRIQYLIKTGHYLHLKKARRFTEKLQQYKVYYRNPLMKRCVDKFEVRSYIEEIGLGSILNECYGVFSNIEDICWDSLPNSFVIKDTLGGSGLSVKLIPDKSCISKNLFLKEFNRWLSEPYNKKHTGREWVYDGRPHRIVIERFIESEKDSGGLIDYKFFCNYGLTRFLYVIADRNLGRGGALGVYTPEFQRINVERADERPLSREVKKPCNFEEMRMIAEMIGKPFPESRVDLYNVAGRIVFGEITFFDGSGYMKFIPDEYDKRLGDLFHFSYDSNWKIRP